MVQYLSEFQLENENEKLWSRMFNYAKQIMRKISPFFPFCSYYAMADPEFGKSGGPGHRDLYERVIWGRGVGNFLTNKSLCMQNGIQLFELFHA